MKTRIFLSLLLAVALLQGCSKSGGASSTPANGSVRLVNAALNYASLDLNVPGSTIATAVTTGGASTYIPIAPGVYPVSLVATGTGNPLTQQSLMVSTNVSYALVAHNEGGQLKLTALTENEVAPASGDGKIRLSNLALTDTGGVDVYVAASGGTLANTSAIVSNLGIASGYYEIPQGTYQVWVTGVGNKADVRLYLPSVVIANQQVATLVLTAATGGTLVDGWLVTQSGTVSAQTNTSARIRVAANIASSGTVVATANGVLLDASTLVSPQLDSYAVVPSGALTMSVVVGGATVSVPNLTAAAGADYTLLAAGTAAAPQFFLLGDDNTLPVGGKAKLRLVNAVNGFAGSLSLDADANLVAQNVAFGKNSIPTTLAISGSASLLQVTPAFAPALTLPALTLQSQGVYSVFVLGGITAPDVPAAIVRADR